ncbi:MAG: vWA domain-containing protein [Pseudomonadota bacterium]
MALKLNRGGDGFGFYESFSDVIFATMAIFVLLMLIFILLANESSPIAKLKKKIAAVEEQIELTNQAKARLDEDSKQRQKEIAKLSERNVEIVIAVDKSSSMEEELNNLKSAIARLGEILPGVSKSVRIGVVAYRINERGRNATETFPIQRIQPASEDGGQSVRKLQQYLRRQTHASGLAPTLQATRTALGMFNQSPSYRGHQVFLLLGDVGPYEESVRGVDRITSAGEARAQSLINDVARWAKARKHRNLIVLFSGRDEVSRTIFGGARQRKHAVSMELFRKIAAAAGQPKAYTENQSSMLADFLVAALKRR